MLKVNWGSKLRIKIEISKAVEWNYGDPLCSFEKLYGVQLSAALDAEPHTSHNPLSEFWRNTSYPEFRSHQTTEHDTIRPHRRSEYADPNLGAHLFLYILLTFGLNR